MAKPLVRERSTECMPASARVLRVRARACVRVRACVRACVCACVRACVRARERERDCVCERESGVKAWRAIVRSSSATHQS